ncbi:translation elongation factor 4 [Patescibacteria group bacterium]|nr:translation elongation factor 4 [Patescibacteria group bacterium]
MDQKLIRNFCIIAHIDHGKSTLADRFLEITKTVNSREMKNQLLDQMDLERERGITIKLQPVSMQWQGHYLNLIDTPGHVDFSYEVSRSLQAVEGAILLVDATQGIQAQTLANFELAKEQGLTIIPVINKLDLPAADPDKVAAELADLLQIEPSEVLRVSAKEGSGVAEVLNEVIKKVPSPKFNLQTTGRALIFDSRYDDFRGVVASVRLTDGQIKTGDKYWLLGSQDNGEILETGVYSPKYNKTKDLVAGQIGYIVTGLKDIRQVRVGDTLAVSKQAQPLPGYVEVKPMVYAGLYPGAGENPSKLREALEKLKLNDASLMYEGEHSPALGYGFRCGFLGLLHLDVTRERLQREYDLAVIITTPSVAYEVVTNKNETFIVRGALDLPARENIKSIKEPMVRVDMVTPSEYIGNLMGVAQDFRGLYLTTDYLGGQHNQARAVLRYEMPLSAILVDFYDQIKGVSAGYASLNYEFLEYRDCDIKRLDILVADEVVEALATIVYTDEAYRRARTIVGKLKDLLPRQMFEVKIQAAFGAKVLASERIPAMRKDVTAKLYGGDVTRKRKLLEKQKAGKKRMRLQGKVAIPSKAYLALISRQE